MKNEWKREYAGRYTSRISGWVIEQSNDDNRWVVFSPNSDTHRGFDSFEKLREAKQHYSNIKPEGEK